MRSFSRGAPDFEEVSVLSQESDGRYLVKRDHWPYPIKVKATPPGAQIPTPIRLKLLFELGDRQKPFLFYPRTRYRAKYQENGVVSLTDWLCQFAYFARENGLTLEFDAAGATEVTDDLNTAPFNLRSVGGVLAYCNVDGGFRLVLGSEVILQAEFANPLNPDPVITRLTWDGIAAYLIFGANALALPDKVARWTADGTKTYEYHIFGTSTATGATSDVTLWENSGGTERVLIAGLVESEGDIAAQVVSWDSDTSANLVIGAPISPRETTSFWSGNWQILNTCFQGDAQTFLSGNRWVIPGRRGEIHCIDAEDLSVQWTAPNQEGHEYRLLRPLGIVGGRLLCAFEDSQFYELVDYKAAHDFDNPVLEAQTPRTKLEEGLSLTAGLCTLNLSNGQMIDEIVFEGSDPNGSHFSAFTDLVVTESSDSFTTPGGGPGEPNEYWLDQGLPLNTFTHYARWSPCWELSNPEWDGTITPPNTPTTVFGSMGTYKNLWDALIAREVAREAALKAARPDGYQLLGRVHRRRAPFHEGAPGYASQRLTLERWPLPLNSVRDPDADDPFSDWQQPDMYAYDTDTGFLFFQNAGGPVTSGYHPNEKPKEQLEDPENFPGPYTLAFSGPIVVPPEEEGGDVDFQWKTWFRSGQDERFQLKTTRPQTNLTLGVPFAGHVVVGPDGLSDGNTWTAYTPGLTVGWTFTYTLFSSDLEVQLPVATGSKLQILVNSDTIGARLITLDAGGAKVNERAAAGFAPLVFDGTRLWLDDGTSRWEP